jgi:hypothetical protein
VFVLISASAAFSCESQRVGNSECHRYNIESVKYHVANFGRPF